MEFEPQNIALLSLRIFIGLVFFFQGFDKVFRVKVSGVAATFSNQFAQHKIPSGLVWFMAFLTSYAELIGGLLLIFGLFKYCVLYVLMADIIIASIGFSIIQPMWDMKHIFPRIAILTALLLLPENWDIFTLDSFFRL